MHLCFGLLGMLVNKCCVNFQQNISLFTIIFTLHLHITFITCGNRSIYYAYDLFAYWLAWFLSGDRNVTSFRLINMWIIICSIYLIHSMKWKTKLGVMLVFTKKDVNQPIRICWDFLHFYFMNFFLQDVNRWNICTAIALHPHYLSLLFKSHKVSDRRHWVCHQVCAICMYKSGNRPFKGSMALSLICLQNSTISWY